MRDYGPDAPPHASDPMLRLAPLVLAAALSGCTLEHRTDGGSPIHADNGAQAAPRDAVDGAARRDLVEPLSSEPGASSFGAANAGTAPSGASAGAGAPVPTPRLGTVAQGNATPAPGSPGATGGMNAGAIQAPPGAPGAIPPPRAQ